MLTAALVLSLFVTASCNEDATPTQPGSTDGSAFQPALLTATASNTWTAKATGNWEFPVAESIANPSGQGLVYVFGGHDGEIQSSVVGIYHLDSDTWTYDGPFYDLELSLMNGVGAIGGKLYVSGGYDISEEGFERETIVKIPYSSTIPLPIPWS
ncbi:MAG: kelch repeat-containing protein [Gemmatimonadales bacterium]